MMHSNNNIPKKEIELLDDHGTPPADHFLSVDLSGNKNQLPLVVDVPVLDKKELQTILGAYPDFLSTTNVVIEFLLSKGKNRDKRKDLNEVLLMFPQISFARLAYALYHSPGIEDMISTHPERLEFFVDRYQEELSDSEIPIEELVFDNVQGSHIFRLCAQSQKKKDARTKNKRPLFKSF